MFYSYEYWRSKLIKIKNQNSVTAKKPAPLDYFPSFFELKINVGTMTNLILYFTLHYRFHITKIGFVIKNWNIFDI